MIPLRDPCAYGGSTGAHERAKKTGQGGHILRASASAARIGEMEAGGGPAIGDALLERSRQRATPVLIDVLRRYPPATSGSNRLAQLMSALDHSLRQAADRRPGHTALSRADARRRERTS